jgi:CRISPR system Cascade subunit CasD
MREHLVFTLAAQIAAMGELAGHERRGTWSWPGRSAVIGLLGAALGLRREDDFSRLDALSMAVAAFDQGIHLRDYHTVATVPSTRARRPQSRAEALQIAGHQANTTITQRDYRTGVLYGVAIWGGPLEPLRDALLRPEFVLYLGRKSCPLSAPCAPRIVSAPDAAGALAQVQLPPWRSGGTAQLLATEEEGEDGRLEQRYDRVLDRRLWHFGSRTVRLCPADIRPVPGPSEGST